MIVCPVCLTAPFVRKSVDALSCRCFRFFVGEPYGAARKWSFRYGPGQYMTLQGGQLSIGPVVRPAVVGSNRGAVVERIVEHALADEVLES